MTTEQIFQTLGIEDSSDQVKAKILSNILNTADLRFAGVVDEVMTDEERKEFEEFSEGKAPEEISKWVNEKYEGISEVYNGIIEQIVDDLKNKNQSV